MLSLKAPAPSPTISWVPGLPAALPVGMVAAHEKLLSAAAFPEQSSTCLWRFLYFTLTV